MTGVSYPPNPKGWDHAMAFLKKTGYQPNLMMEIDRDITFDQSGYKKHTFWRKLRDGLKDKDYKFLDGMKAIVIGNWAMDCVHGCRSEMHPIFGLAIRETGPAEGNTDTWHFMTKARGNQAFCGQGMRLAPKETKKRYFYFRFPARKGMIIKDIREPSVPNGRMHKHGQYDPSWAYWKTKTDEVVVRVNLPHYRDWLIGTLLIDWKKN